MRKIFTDFFIFYLGNHFFCIFAPSKVRNVPAEVAQLVEHNLAKVRVASSSLVFRSNPGQIIGVFFHQALVVELVDTRDLKSREQQCSCGFNSRPRYKKNRNQLLINGCDFF